MPDSNHDNISTRQVLALLFAALLSPAVQLLPGRTAATAGGAAWLSVLPALPLVLLLCAALSGLLRAAPDGTGLAGAYRSVFGGILGRIICAGYFLWGAALLCVGTKWCALRFLSTSYRNAPLGLFLVVLLAAAWWMGRKKLAAFARAGEIFYLALSILLTIVLFFGLFRVEAAYVLPVWWDDLPAILYAGIPVLGVLGCGVFGAFLCSGTELGGHKKAMRWAAALCGVLALLQFVCLGSFGAALIGRMDIPFFMMVKGIGVEGAFERIESVVIALWVLSDLAFLGLLAFGCRRIAADLVPVLGRRDGARGVVLPLMLAALIGAVFFCPDAFLLSELAFRLLTAGGILFGFAIPLLAWLVARLRGILKN